MRWLGAALSLMAVGCIDFDTRLAECTAGRGWCASDAGASIDGGARPDGGLRSAPVVFCSDDGFCWVHPRPFGEWLTAVDGTGVDDLWVAGRAGLVAHWNGSTWSDHRAPVLDATCCSDINTLVVSPEGVFIAGDGRTPMRANPDGGWVTERYIALPSEVGTTWNIEQLRPALSTLMAVGERSDGVLLVAIRQLDGSWRELDSGLAGKSYALVGGAAPMLAVEQGAENALVSPNGVRLAGTPSIDVDTPGVYALWEQPGAGVWVAGSRGFLDLFDGGLLNMDTAASCPPGQPTFHAGRWMSGPGRNVVVGADDTIFEGAWGRFTDAQPGPWLAGTRPSFSDVWVDNNGNGLAVSDVAVAAWRDRSSGKWGSANAFLGIAQDVREDLWAIAEADGGLYVGGAGSLEASVSLSDGELQVLGEVSSEDRTVKGMWTDGKGMLLTIQSDHDSAGELCQVAADGSCNPLATQNAPLYGLWVDSPDNLIAVGAGGSILRIQDGGLRRVAPSGGAMDLQAVVRSQGRLYAGGWDGEKGGVYEIGEDLSLTARWTGYGVTAFAAAPDGGLWAMGDHSLLLKLAPSGTWLPEPQPSVRGSTLSGAFAFDEKDVWASGTEGVVLHYNGKTWEYVESGTRVDLLRLVGRQIGGTREVWLAGRSGALLVHRYPAP